MALHFKKGDLVWAKMKGYPYWPGIVTDPLKEMKVPKNNTSLCIYFFGSKNYALIDTKNLKDYKSNKSELEKSCKSGGLKAALKEIDEFMKRGDGSLDVKDEDPFDKLISATATSTPKPSKKTSSVAENVSEEESKKRNSTGDEGSTPSKKKSMSKGLPKIALKGKSPKGNKESTPSSKKGMSSPNISEMDLSVMSSPSRLSKNNYGSLPAFDDTILRLPNVSAELLKKVVDPSALTFGFVGIDNKSCQLLKNLLHTEHEIVIWNPTVEMCYPFEKIGARVARSLQELVNDVDIVILCLNDDVTASETIHGKNVLKIIHGTNKGFVNLGNSSPHISELFSDELKYFGCRYLDVRLLGNPQEEVEYSMAFAAGDYSLYVDFQSCLTALATESLYFEENIAKMIARGCMFYAIRGSLLVNFTKEILNILIKDGISNAEQLLLTVITASPEFDDELKKLYETKTRQSFLSSNFTDYIRMIKNDERCRGLPRLPLLVDTLKN